MLTRFLKFLQRVDQRFVYLFMALAVILPALFPGLVLPITVTQPVKNLYDAVEQLPEGSKIFVPLDFDPKLDPELSPMAVAFLQHCFRKGHKVVAMTMFTEGVDLAYNNVRKAASHEYRKIILNEKGEPLKTSGGEIRTELVRVDAKEYEDWVYLGMQPGG